MPEWLGASLSNGPASAPSLLAWRIGAALVLGDPMIEITLAATLVAIASTSLGLLASALVRTTEQTTPILVVSVMFQLVL